MFLISLLLILTAYFYPLFIVPKGLIPYVIPPVMYLLVLGLLFRDVSVVRTFFEGSLLGLVLLFFVIGVVSDFLLGFLSGFGRNPLTLTPTLILLNLMREVPIVLGAEFFRGYVLINSRRVKTSLLLISLFLTLTRFTHVRYLSLAGSGYPEIVGFALRSFTPVLAQNILVSYTFLLGGIKPSLMYSLLGRLYTYLMPVLPDVSSGVSAVSSVIQVFVFLVIMETALEQPTHTYRRTSKTSNIINAVFLLIILAVLVSMMSGYRALVVLSGSMTPALNLGDVVVVSPVADPADVRVGDIVAFYLMGDVIVHRVVEVYNFTTGMQYQTKGDANRDVDPFRVTRDSLIGRYMFKVPVVGFLWMYLLQVFMNYQNVLIALALAPLTLTAGRISYFSRWLTRDDE